ncbi:hypothetical protein [Streptacidiphilus fuscans]|uniref:Uncharacterized protein n=1 Tax=Streptacidiphilus fuscans TaxID=2789292 RepID=A0A931FD80_9ACTN|nr:hypothetical protein [Streptacidiphilus fuscans]MBF9067266.1 hypothetical protein [Streptacidiphilus fuscans]
MLLDAPLAVPVAEVQVLAAGRPCVPLGRVTPGGLYDAGEDDVLMKMGLDGAQVLILGDDEIVGEGEQADASERRKSRGQDRNFRAAQPEPL